MSKAGKKIIAGMKEAVVIARGEDGAPNEPEVVIAAAYQVIGQLADLAGLYDHPEVVRALDYLAYPEKRTEYLEPWPRETLVAQRGGDLIGIIGVVGPTAQAPQS